MQKIPQNIANIREFPSGLAVKDLALLLLWLGFNPWPRILHAMGMARKKFQVFEFTLRALVKPQAIKGMHIRKATEYLNALYTSSVLCGSLVTIKELAGMPRLNMGWT